MQRLRLQIAQLSPDQAALQPLNLPASASHEKRTALLRESLLTIHAHTLSVIETELAKYLDEPAQAALALGESFVDLVAYHREAKEEWNIFYRFAQDRIWPELVENGTRREVLQKEWQTLIAHARNELNALEGMLDGPSWILQRTLCVEERLHPRKRLAEGLICGCRCTSPQANASRLIA
jgi:hypothetical protein